MMRRVVELEKTEKAPSHLELFKGTDLYRTLIVCGVYLAQNLTGNLIANQAVYFFRRKSSPVACLTRSEILTASQRLAWAQTRLLLLVSSPRLFK